ncbi:THO complex subunit 1 [Entomortierella parvispora]|uniref:THO complex subunit 1 n=1 Tax=Entomortierella parvispora TaxID=205924 RepID=A0A9P3HJC4_9FUNG|nr:THO complex subunit 1 [Entomortierella parvispora]
MLSLPPYAPLLETADAIGKLLPHVYDTTGDDKDSANQYTEIDEYIQTRLVPTLATFKALDRASLLEAAFKLKLISIQDELGTDMAQLKDAMFRCLDLLLRCSELGLIEHSLPLNLIEEVLDFQTVECSEGIYNYIESRVERLTVNMVAGKGKGLTLLRLCNELLRRLSKAKNTVFCGRILMLLSSVFPLTERSGVNLRGEINTENITHIESGEVSIVPDVASSPSRQRSKSSQDQSTEKMDVDEEWSSLSQPDSPEEESKSGTSKKDFDFYTEFWGLQTFFSNPSLLVNNPDNMKKLQRGIEHTLEKFAKIDEKESAAGQRRSSVDASAHKSQSTEPSGSQAESSSTISKKRKHAQINDAPEPSTYFPKFLTSPKLLQLEMVDPYFRRHILVQFLISIKYLQHHTTAITEAYTKLPTSNKLFVPQWVLDPKDREWTEEFRPRVLKALRAVGVETGDLSFYNTVRSVISDEQSWIQWKAENCQSFEKAPVSTKELDEIQRKRRALSLGLLPLTNKLGCKTLSVLWEKAAETREDGELGSSTRPTDVESYLSSYQFLQNRAKGERLRQGKSPMTPKEAKEMERANLWRGLRLGARQYLHLYSKVATDINSTVKDLKTLIDEDLEWEETIRENGGVVPPPPPPAVVKTSDAATPATANGESTSSDVIPEQSSKEDDELDAQESTESKAPQEAAKEADGDSVMVEEKTEEVELDATPKSDVAPSTEPGTPLDDASKDDASKDDTPKDDASKDGTPKDDTKDDTPKNDTPMDEAKDKSMDEAQV